LVAVTWAPVMIGAIMEGRAFEAKATSDPLLRHFGVHARLLLSLPLLLLAEVTIGRAVPAFLRHFTASGLIGDAGAPRFEAILRQAVRVRDSRWGDLLVVAAILGVSALSSMGGPDGHELSWAEGGEGRGFAAAWYVFVSRPVFIGMLAIWAWRLGTGVWLMERISKLDLQLVASHPDRTGGLGFLEGLGSASAPFAMGLSVVIAGRWGHDVLYHGAHVGTYKPLMITFVAAMMILFAGPLLLFSGSLRAMKRRSLLEYGGLVGSQGRLVHQKWLKGEDPGDDPILSAPELGPVADVNSLYESVAQMKIAPIGMRLVLPVAAASIAPMLPVLAVEIPIKEMLSKIAGALL
jgi:hypothetical protein